MVKNKDKITYQQPLDKWFQRKDLEGNQIEATYTNFYLSWSDNSSSKPIAIWSGIVENQKPLYQTQIKCSDISTQNLIHLMGSDWDIEKDRVDGVMSENFSQETYYTNIAFLKSHLQKAIRRSEINLALKTANHFMKLDMGQFLRRISIIMIEDCHLMTSFPVLIWLMAVQSKGYDLTKSQIYWLFGLVYNLAICKHWDTYIQEYIGTDEFDKFNIKKANMQKLNVSQKSLIYSLQFRKSFGGLKGDKKLLQSAIEVWYKRFLNGLSGGDNWISRIDEYPVRLLSPPEEGLKLHEWILPAIDFHCMPNIMSILMDKYEEFSYDDIKNAIWYFSSSYNNKIVETKLNNSFDKNRLNSIWVTIRPQFYSLAQFFLKNNY